MRVIQLQRRHIYFMLSITLVLAILWQLYWLGQNLITVFKPSTDWGLSFGESGTQPRGNVDAKTLLTFQAMYVGGAADKILYLTFDAGYENGFTPSILDTLNKHKAKAAFFLVGNFVQRNPDLTKRIVKDGHIVGNHTYHHYNVSKITDPEEFKQELKDLEDLFYETTGVAMTKFYRPPEGKFSEQNLRMAQQLGYSTFFWSLAYMDWDNNNQPSHEVALNKLLPRTHNGAIVLLHCTSKTNAEILDALLTQWENQGYKFGSLNDLAVTLKAN